MKRWAYFVAYLFVLPVLAEQPVQLPEVTPEFKPSVFQKHIEYLASDDLEGRGIGTEGIRLAEEYIVKYFKKAGLKPAGENGTWFQNFDMKTGSTLDEKSKLTIKGLEFKPVMKKDYIPFPFSSQKKFAGDVVFCGYGIANADKNHDDYLGVDVTDKVVLVFRKEPVGWQEKEGHYTHYAEFQTKIINARARGAAAILIVDQKPGEDETSELFTFDKNSGSSDYGLPAIHVTREFAEKLLKAGGLESIDALQAKADSSEPCTAPLVGVSISGTPGVKWERSDVRNVIGLLPGTGSLKDEYVVIGAHHDHLGKVLGGIGSSRGKKTDEPVIHNGADDNASGTVGVMELARAFSEAGPANRSILFMCYTAEESGLIGSMHYVDAPTVPLKKIVAMYNMDMIGRMRLDKPKIQVFGVESGEGMEEFVQESADSLGLTIESIGDNGGSDHVAFYGKGIPSLHFFTGVNVQYHTPEDDSHLINAKGGADTLRLVYDIARRTAEKEERIAFRKTPMRMRGHATGFRVVMGIMPELGESDEPGMGVVMVSHDKPAERAGIIPGDRILKLAGKEVTDVYSYMGALAGHKPGDKVKVEILREGKKKVIEVTLMAG